MIFVGVDWAEAHHDVHLADEEGKPLGAKSDAGDAQVLSDMVRTDRHNHRLVAGDSEEVEAIKILARAHQSMVWSRGRQSNHLRSTLREFYPAALVAFEDLTSTDALAVLRPAPTPELGKKLSRAKIASALARGGRQRRIEERSIEIQGGLPGTGTTRLYELWVTAWSGSSTGASPTTPPMTRPSPGPTVRRTSSPPPLDKLRAWDV